MGEAAVDGGEIMKLLSKRKNVTCYCDFCGKSDREVSEMVDGKHAFICIECIEAARDLVCLRRLTVVK